MGLFGPSYAELEAEVKKVKDLEAEVTILRQTAKDYAKLRDDATRERDRLKRENQSVYDQLRAAEDAAHRAGVEAGTFVEKTPLNKMIKLLSMDIIRLHNEKVARDDRKHELEREARKLRAKLDEKETIEKQNAPRMINRNELITKLGSYVPINTHIGTFEQQLDQWVNDLKAKHEREWFEKGTDNGKKMIALDLVKMLAENNDVLDAMNTYCAKPQEDRAVMSQLYGINEGNWIECGDCEGDGLAEEDGGGDCPTCGGDGGYYAK